MPLEVPTTFRAGMIPTVAPRISSIGTMHQGPMPPWRTEEEKEDYKADPHGFLLDRWRLLEDNIQAFHNWVITATYFLPDSFDVQGGGKLYLPDKVHDEALWQGKVGLVVAKGPLAFKNDEHVDFQGQDVAIGDWVMYDIMEGRQFTIERLHCRRLKDTQIVARVKDPRLIY